MKEAAKLQAMAGLYLAQNLKTHVDVLNEVKAAIVDLRKAGTKVVSKVREKSNGKLK